MDSWPARLTSFQHVYKNSIRRHDRSPRLTHRALARRGAAGAHPRHAASRLESRACRRCRRSSSAARRHAPRGHGATVESRPRCHGPPRRALRQRALGRRRRAPRLRRRGRRAVRRRARPARARARPGAAVAQRRRSTGRCRPRRRVRPAGRVGASRGLLGCGTARQRGPVPSSRATGRAAMRASASRRARGRGSTRHGHLASAGRRECRRARRTRSPHAVLAAPARSLARFAAAEPAAPPAPVRIDDPTRLGDPVRMTTVRSTTTNGGPPDGPRPGPHHRALVPDWPIIAACGEAGSIRRAARPDRARPRLRLLPRRAPRRRHARPEAARGAVALHRRSPCSTTTPRSTRASSNRSCGASKQMVPGVQLIRPGTLAMRARGPGAVLRRGGCRGAGPPRHRRRARGARCPGRHRRRTVRRRAGRARGRRSGPCASSRPGDPPPSSPRSRRARRSTRARRLLLSRLGMRTLGEFAALSAADVRRAIRRGGRLRPRPRRGPRAGAASSPARPRPTSRPRIDSSRRSTASTSSPSRSVRRRRVRRALRAVSSCAPPSG